MANAIASPTRTLTIPEELAQAIDRMCAEDKIDPSELIRRAVRTLEASWIQWLIEQSRPQELRDEDDRRLEEVTAMIKQERKLQPERKSA